MNFHLQAGSCPILMRTRNVLLKTRSSKTFRMSSSTLSTLFCTTVEIPEIYGLHMVLFKCWESIFQRNKQPISRKRIHSVSSIQLDTVSQGKWNKSLLLNALSITQDKSKSLWTILLIINYIVSDWSKGFCNSKKHTEIGIA